MIKPPRRQDTKTNKIIKPLSAEYDGIAKKIVEYAFRVHKNLGPGLVENAYEICFCHELAKAKLNFKTQQNLPIQYDGLLLKAGFRIDVIVEDKIIYELKAVEELRPIHAAQLLTYLKLSKKRLGFLINFNSVLIKDGIKRLIL